MRPPADFAGWVPAYLTWETPLPAISWVYQDAPLLAEPFFEHTLANAVRSPFGLLFRRQTSLAELSHLLARRPEVVPTGFIFHMSRCGSTLVSNLLKTLPETRVISEPGVVSALLRFFHRNPDFPFAEKILHLKNLVQALGYQPDGRPAGRFFLKLDALDTLALPLFQAAFPTVPWIFVFRRPVEVLVSNLNEISGGMFPGTFHPTWVGISWEDAFNLPPETYMARLLGRVCETAVSCSSPHSRFIDYETLPGAVWTTVADFFQLDLSPTDVERMQSAAGFDAKRPDQTFQDDRDRKRASASVNIRQAVAEWLEPHDQALRLHS
ncbi:MAG: hypothetical protein K1Y36_10130 [Blastocatellia bacterium]|nr:hypothetical protein [Blastocatellia bacterium]